jgi:hypothetical protein
MAEVIIDMDLEVAFVKPVVHEKYARKLIQDRLKAETPYKGGWTVWHRESFAPDEVMVYTFSNPYRDTAQLAALMLKHPVV